MCSVHSLGSNYPNCAQQSYVFRSESLLLLQDTSPSFPIIHYPTVRYGHHILSINDSPTPIVTIPSILSLPLVVNTQFSTLDTYLSSFTYPLTPSRYGFLGCPRLSFRLNLFHGKVHRD